MRDRLVRLWTGVKDFFKTIWRQKAGRVLLTLAGALLLAAVGVGVGIYLEGNTAAHSAQQLLERYERGAEPTTSRLPAQPVQSGQTGAADATLESVEGYDVIGVLSIQKIGQELPVISQTSEEALKISVCWFAGSLPGETGNMVITGHDYASGAHFGRLSELKAGDAVTLTAGNNFYAFEVYETEVIKPDQREKLNDYEGDTALTLLTCTSHGNRRLVVRCKPVA